MNRHELQNAYVRFLSRYDWNFFGTLTFRGYPPTSKADHCFRQWVNEIQATEGTPHFHWFRVTEHGAYGDNVHFHVLIGGLRAGSKYRWILRWNELAGDALISYFHPHQGGIRYLLKTLRPGADFEIDFFLDPRSPSEDDN